MLINVQRVSSSSVEVNGSMVAQIKKGLLCLICAVPNDTVNTCERVVEKLTKLRIFNDLNGKMNKSLIDININKARKFKEIKKLILVYNKKDAKRLKSLKLKNVKFIVGGKSRQQSTFNGLKYLIPKE